METFICKTERIIFPKKGQPECDNGFAIVSVSADGIKDAFNIKGSLPGIRAGMTLSVTGDWKTDKWGRSFSVKSFEEKAPASLEGIRNYLSSGLVRGIGPTLAEQIVSYFGENTLDILDLNPERLSEVKGIGKKKLASLVESWKEQKGIKDVMLFLKTYEVGNALSARIYRKYGDDSIDIIKENPYRLADEVDGIGFLTADAIALSMGVPAQCRERIRSCILYALGDACAKKGHVYLESEQLTQDVTELLNSKDTPVGRADILSAIDFMEGQQDIIRVDPDRIYLPLYYYSERSVAGRAASMLGCIPSEPIDFFSLERDCGLQYDEVQKDAISLAASSRICVITGGPGTGKTTTMKGVILNALRLGKTVLLAAPTGRASRRLAETAGLPASTIHRLLEFKPGEGFTKNESDPLQGDLLVVDESSMIDVLLMSSLLKAVPPTMSVVLVGDVDQLPSVGPGNVLKDLIRSGRIPVVRLTRIFRQAQDSLIVRNAHAINRGYVPELPCNLSPAGEDFCFIPREDAAAMQNDVLTLMADYIPNQLGYGVDDIQVLSPMRKGPLGTNELNRLLQQRLNPDAVRIIRGFTEFRKGDRVIQVKNNYDWDVFNGDIGRITEVDTEKRELTIDFNGTVVQASGEDLDHIDLAYCTTIHKSQGSEYPVVIVPVTMSHYIMLMRNLLYTAVTRAKRRCILVGEKKAVMTMIGNNTVAKRNTALWEIIRDIPGNLF